MVPHQTKDLRVWPLAYRCLLVGFELLNMPLEGDPPAIRSRTLRQPNAPVSPSVLRLNLPLSPVWGFEICRIRGAKNRNILRNDSEGKRQKTEPAGCNWVMDSIVLG